jgi:queuine tRNA-ribosyltransferase
MSGVFAVEKRDGTSGARQGRLRTLHGEVETPIFMPVGTQGTVKGLLPEQVRQAGAQILLGNTYHLNLRPSSERVAELGGLHRFMRWDKPILTDSGGFQVFSLAQLRKIEADGIRFRSHLDGAEVWLTPRRVMDIQANLGSDIAMVLDECPASDSSREAVELAVERTVRWAAEARAYIGENGFLEKGHHVFAIVQGSRHKDLRVDCAEKLVAMDFPGYAIGGVSVGEPEEEMIPQVQWCTEVLPQDKPRYVMGVGTPRQLVKMVTAGADMFDCVMPTREARHGIAYTDEGRLNLKNQRFRDDKAPLMERFADQELGRFSRAYIRHLISAGESLGGLILSYHNLRYYLDLMARIRAWIGEGHSMHDFEL